MNRPGYTPGTWNYLVLQKIRSLPRVPFTVTDLAADIAAIEARYDNNNVEAKLRQCVNQHFVKDGYVRRLELGVFELI
jgi:hypothetical protein